EIRFFDPVKVDDIRRADAEQRKILQHLVAERPRADDEHLRAREFFLIPPRDEAKAAVTVVVGDDEGVGHAKRGSGLEARDWGSLKSFESRVPSPEPQVPHPSLYAHTNPQST